MKDLDFIRTNLKALGQGKPLVDLDGTQLYLKGVTLGRDHEEDQDRWCEYSLDELNDLEVYKNPLQDQLDAANSLVAMLKKEVESLKRPWVKPEVAKKHLNTSEVREIELIFEKGSDISQQDIAKGIDVSQTVVSNIYNGTHSKTSGLYKAYLMKKNLG